MVMGQKESAQIMAAMEKIHAGGKAKLSLAQIANMVVNLQDASRSLTPEQFQKVMELFKQYQKCDRKESMDLNLYGQIALLVIKDFDKIAPYEKYSGGDEREYAEFMESVRSGSLKPDIGAEGKFILMKNASARTGKKETIKAAIIILCVIIFGSLYTYVHDFSSGFGFIDEVYSRYDDELDRTEYIIFGKDRICRMLSYDETEKTVSGSVLSYYGRNWNRLFADLYFSRDDLLSLKKVEKGAKPATLHFSCEDSFYIDPDEAEKVTVEENIGIDFTSVAYFSSDHMLLDGMKFDKVDHADEMMLNIIDDPSILKCGTGRPKIGTGESMIRSPEERLAEILTDAYNEEKLEFQWEIVPEDGFVDVRVFVDGTIDLFYDAYYSKNQNAIDEWNEFMDNLIEINLVDSKLAEECGYSEILVCLTVMDDYEGDILLAMIANGDVLRDPVNGIDITEGDR